MMRPELSWFTPLTPATLARAARLVLAGLALCAVTAQSVAQTDAGAEAGSVLPGDVYVDEARGVPPYPEPPPELSVTKRNKVDRALKKFTSKKPKARESQVQTVLDIGRGAVPLLVDHAETTSAEKQQEIARCLATLADERDRLDVESWMVSELVALRRAGVTLAGRIATERLVDLLPARLDDEDAAVRFEAALALAATGHDDGVDQLVAAFDESTSERIVAAAAGLAERSGNHSRLRKHLVVDEKLAKRDPHAAAVPRRAAVAMLASIGDRAAVSALVTSLDDPNSLVQLDAIDALREILEDAEPFDATSIFAQIKEVERLKGVAATRR